GYSRGVVEDGLGFHQCREFSGKLCSSEDFKDCSCVCRGDDAGEKEGWEEWELDYLPEKYSSDNRCYDNSHRGEPESGSRASSKPFKSNVHSCFEEQWREAESD